MAFDAIRKELQRVVCTCYLACPAVALCEGGKTLPLSDRSEGALTNLRSFEIASKYNYLYLSACKISLVVVY